MVLQFRHHVVGIQYGHLINNNMLAITSLYRVGHTCTVDLKASQLKLEHLAYTCNYRSQALPQRKTHQMYDIL